MGVRTFGFSHVRVAIEDAKHVVEFDPGVEFIEDYGVLVVVAIPPFAFGFPVCVREDFSQETGFATARRAPYPDYVGRVSGIIVCVSDEANMIDSTIMSGVLGWKSGFDRKVVFSIVYHFDHCEQCDGAIGFGEDTYFPRSE